MGWFSASVSYEGKDEKREESTYGTRTPIVSGQYNDAYNNFRNSLNPNGFNASQQNAVDRTNNYLNSGGAAARVAPVNNDLRNISTNLNRYTSGTPNLLSPTAPRATAGTATAGTATAGNATAGTATAGRANATLIDMVDPITAERVAATTGAQYMDAYRNPYENDVVATSLADYDLGASEARNALRASSAGAFGNKRTGVAEGQFASDAALGRGQLAAGIRSEGFKTAAEYGSRDSDRRLTGDIANQDAALRAATSNADNLLRGRTFNAGAQNDVSITNANNDTSTSVANANNQTSTSVANANNQTSTSATNANNATSTSVANANNNTSVSTTNAGIQNTRDITDVNSRNTADTNAVNALAEQADISTDVANNIFKADGIDIQAAENMFTAGTISQTQLQTIMDAAAAYNGSTFNQNVSGRTNTDTYGTEVGF